MSRYLLAGQVVVVLPAVLRTAPRDRVGGAAQLRAGAVRVDVEAGGQVPQGAVRLRDELLERAGVARGENQAVTQRVGLPAAAGVGHAEPGARAAGGVLELVGTRVRAVVADEVRGRVRLGGGPADDLRPGVLGLPEDVEPVPERVDQVAVVAHGV